ncbi:hypothetical protein Ocin01_00679 [Orchesella cincta]|uniref:RING-type domain-containing protein n=1 Tax=Orchesella cincta TaxID=48709 RepID=A0A1D2NL16_ORCCI|nr:hypothetical protein Ocin01_00679 [Orchesella cincta]
MFICKLCNESLQRNQDIFGTFCGHIFHQKCLNKYLFETSSSCPTCQKSLCIDPTSTKADYCLLPLYPEGNEEPFEHKISEKSAIILQENAMLKRKLLEVIHALVLQQKENKDRRHIDLLLSPQHQNRKSPENFKNGYGESSVEHIGSPTSKKGKQKFKLHKPKTPEKETNNNVTEASSYATAVDTLDLLDPDLLTLCTQPNTIHLSEEDENRILRSKRREYLTWRNKAQSWLSKMQVAFNKLLEAESLFSPKEFLQELRNFFNKMYNQGEIVDTAKQAGVVYIIMAEISQTETDEIHETIIRLARAYSGILTNIMDALNRLESNYETGGINKHSEKDSTSWSNYNSIESPDRCSSISDDMDDDNEQLPESTVIITDSHVSHRPTSFTSNVVLYLEQDEDDYFREPIFV